MTELPSTLWHHIALLSMYFGFILHNYRHHLQCKFRIFQILLLYLTSFVWMTWSNLVIIHAIFCHKWNEKFVLCFLVRLSNVVRRRKSYRKLISTCSGVSKWLIKRVLKKCSMQTSPQVHSISNTTFFPENVRHLKLSKTYSDRNFISDHTRARNKVSDTIWYQT